MPIGRRATVHLQIAEFYDNQKVDQPFTHILMDKKITDKKIASADPKSVAVELMTGMDIFATIDVFDMAVDSSEEYPLTFKLAKPMFAAPRTIRVITEGVIRGIWVNSDGFQNVPRLYLFPGMIACYIEKYTTYALEAINA